MSTATIAGHEVAVDKDGFMTNPQEWTPEIATAIAASLGLALTERHWKVIEFCRRDAADKGEPPGLRRIAQGAEIPVKELYQLFPKGPGILAAKVSGLTKPKSCV
jgi:dissimilatory sulfite reductase related protein